MGGAHDRKSGATSTPPSKTDARIPSTTDGTAFTFQHDDKHFLRPQRPSVPECCRRTGSRQWSCWHRPSHSPIPTHTSESLPASHSTSCSRAGTVQEQRVAQMASSAVLREHHAQRMRQTSLGALMRPQHKQQLEVREAHGNTTLRRGWRRDW